MEIKLNTTGKIVNGEHAGWYVFVQDDREGDTGGIYILIMENKSGSGQAYDDWIEDIGLLIPHFEYNKWEIEWE